MVMTKEHELFERALNYLKFLKGEECSTYIYGRNAHVPFKTDSGICANVFEIFYKYKQLFRNTFFEYLTEHKIKHSNNPDTSFIIKDSDGNAEKLGLVTNKRLYFTSDNLFIKNNIGICFGRELFMEFLVKKLDGMVCDNDMPMRKEEV